MAIRRSFLLLTAVLGLFFTTAMPVVHAQESSSDRNATEEHNEFPWHVINSGIFAALFGYAVWKYSPAFFNARSEDIQKAIKEATGLKMQADFRYSEMDRKIATLPAEVERMRGESKAAMDREEQRRHEELQRELQHIEDSLQAEMEGARAEGRLRIQREAALEALESAEQRLRERAAAGQSEDLLGEFLGLVARGKTR